MRLARGPLGRHDHGVLDPRRPADGHAAGTARPRRAFVPDDRQRLRRAGIDELLYKQSGLAGLSGISNDWREIEAAGTPQARDAIAYFVQRCVYEIGGLAATLGGLDALVFTGGIGEHSASLRACVCGRLTWLGATLDAQANAAQATLISRPGSALGVYVIPTDEERRIAQGTHEALAEFAVASTGL